MIKTVSFAPSRPARATKPASSPASKAANKAANARGGTAKSATKPANSAPDASTASSQEKPSSVKTAKAPATMDVYQARAALQKSGKTRAAKTTRTPEVPASIEETPAEQTPAKRAPRKATKAAAPAKAKAARDKASASADAEVEAAPPESAATIMATRAKSAATETAATSEAPAKPKVKRSRVPKDLAAQYGGAPTTEAAPRPALPEAPAPRKRMTRAKKDERAQRLTPDEELLQRLQAANAVEVKKPASRGRGWEFECGRCGRISRFQTPGALCECGAIAVRE